MVVLANKRYSMKMTVAQKKRVNVHYIITRPKGNLTSYQLRALLSIAIEDLFEISSSRIKFRSIIHFLFTYFTK